MDKAAILTTSRVEPGISLAPRSHASVLTLLGPTFQYVARFQGILSASSMFVCMQAYSLAAILLANAWYASKILAFRACVASSFGLFHAFSLSNQALRTAWDSKHGRMLRKKLFHELAVFILGSGNPLILMVFWPGWLVIGGTSFALWQFWG